jgi:hypothetical protein
MRTFFVIAAYVAPVIVVGVIAVAAITAVLYGCARFWIMVMA